MSVEEVGFNVCQTPALKIVELFYKVFVLCKHSVKCCRIKNKPFIDICDYQMLYFKIFSSDSFAQIVKHQFMKCLCIEIRSGYYFTSVRRLFGFDNYTYLTIRFVSVVYYKVCSSFGIDKMIRFIISFFKKIDD